MPYRRRRYGRKKRYSKKSSGGTLSRWGGYAYSGLKAVAMAANALKTANYVAGLINVEKKFFDTTLNSTSISSGGGIFPLSQIAGGTDYNQREGLSVKAVSNQCRMNAYLPSTISSSLGQTLRYMLFIDNDNQGSSPVVSDVLESANVNSPLNHTNGKRFSILADRTYSLAPDASNAMVNAKYFKHLGNHVKWSSSTNTAMREGHLFCLLISDSGTGLNEPVVSFYNRLRYVDN